MVLWETKQNPRFYLCVSLGDWGRPEREFFPYIILFRVCNILQALFCGYIEQKMISLYIYTCMVLWKTKQNHRFYICVSPGDWGRPERVVAPHEHTVEQGGPRPGQGQTGPLCAQPQGGKFRHTWLLSGVQNYSFYFVYHKSLYIYIFMYIYSLSYVVQVLYAKMYNAITA